LGENAFSEFSQKSTAVAKLQQEPIPYSSLSAMQLFLVTIDGACVPLQSNAFFDVFNM
jgi:hypothetical protein